MYNVSLAITGTSGRGGVMLFTSASNGWRVFTEYMMALPPVAWIFLGVLTVVALWVGISSRRWWPEWLLRRVRQAGTGAVWIAAPRVGAITGGLLWLLLFPAVACFSADIMTWVYCFVFGWLGAFFVVLWYFCYTSPSAALLWDGHGYQVASSGGTGHFMDVDRIPHLKITREMNGGDMRYAISGGERGDKKTYCYLTPNDFNEDGRRKLQDFIRIMQTRHD